MSNERKSIRLSFCLSLASYLPQTSSRLCPAEATVNARYLASNNLTYVRDSQAQDLFNQSDITAIYWLSHRGHPPLSFRFWTDLNLSRSMTWKCRVSSSVLDFDCLGWGRRIITYSSLASRLQQLQPIGTWPCYIGIFVSQPWDAHVLCSFLTLAFDLTPSFKGYMIKQPYLLESVYDHKGMECMHTWHTLHTLEILPAWSKDNIIRSLLFHSTGPSFSILIFCIGNSFRLWSTFSSGYLTSLVKPWNLRPWQARRK